MNESNQYVKLWVSYKHYFEPLSKEEIADLVIAMIDYFETGSISPLTGNERFVWPAIKRDIDTTKEYLENYSKKQSENGKKGGRPRKAKPFEDNPENPMLSEETQKTQAFFDEPKKAKEKDIRNKGYKDIQDKDKDKDKDEDEENTIVNLDKGLAEVMDYFLNKINPTAPQFVLDKIKFYYQQMGVDCCKRAFDIALAERKTSWSYIDTILKNKLAQGVKCIADWEESDKKHEDGKRAKEIAKNPGKATSEDFQPKQETIKKNNDWLDKFLDENDPGWRESNKYGT